MKTQDFAVAKTTQEIDIQAPADKVWQALTTETSSWWHKDFYTGPEPKGFHIEAKLGGRVYEDWGDGQGLVWYTVTGIHAGVQLRLSGELVDEAAPARLMMTVDLESRGETTLVRLTEIMFGGTNEKAASCLEEGWGFLLKECFKPFAEQGTRAEIPESVVA